MSLRFRRLSDVLVLVAAAIGFPSAAIAQPALNTQPSGNETISETFNRAFFRNDPDFFRNRSIKRQVDLILGPGSLLRNSFPENEILRDAKLVDILYQDVLGQQASSGPVIRTPDLPNPYETSIFQSPRINVNSPLRELLLRSQPSQ